jgi:copper chaperone CopZ
MTLSSDRQPAPATVRLALSGMHCGSCAALIEDILSDQPGVTRAVVGFEAGEARVTFDPAKVTVDDLCASVAGAGYGASPVERPTAD